MVRAIFGFITRRMAGRSALASKFRCAQRLASTKTTKAVSAQSIARLISSIVMASAFAWPSYINGAPA